MIQNSDLIDISYPVMEHFYTLQGEGKYTGRAAYFIRLGGCDVGCVWCDVKDSWVAEKHPKMNINELITKVNATKSDFVVLTGGEPAMYSLNQFVNQLQDESKYVAIETSGAYSLDAKVDWYTFSPKKFKAPVEEAYEKANELKIVVFNKSDFTWAIEHAEKVNSECLLYIQPEWSKHAQLLPLIIDFVKENPRWKLSLQTHKYLNIP